MRFEKVSFDEFKKSYNKLKSNFESFDDKELKEIYDNIKLPKRATAKSAGYDFYAPFYFEVGHHLSMYNAVVIPTGIKVCLDDDKVLMLAPRSGLGFKRGVELANTIGVIDADYYNNADNEGHIMAKIQTKCEWDDAKINAGDAYMQGIIISYYTVENDCSDSERKGGLGSTG